MFNLFQRHAKAAEDVITAAVAAHVRQLWRNELPAGSLLATCFTRGHVEVRPASDYDAQTKAFVDRLSAPVLEFGVDEVAKRVQFHGGHHLDGANFRIVGALIRQFREAKAKRADVPFLSASQLARALSLDEQSMRQQVSRLRKALEPLTVMLGIPMDQDTFIQTKERDGYRLNPEWREVAIGDIRG